MSITATVAKSSSIRKKSGSHRFKSIYARFQLNYLLGRGDCGPLRPAFAHPRHWCCHILEIRTLKHDYDAIEWMNLPDLRDKGEKTVQVNNPNDLSSPIYQVMRTASSDENC
ncbi:hypothetical protein AVEN_209422-1 [Araneus ventricosus]|uniref:Uncharacterized protein n=1 Tax=Araneus ventricosus TaxID=182803 RepID=A0A4Y2J639_ARAVE|nr:hypothetical protein AVEN_209422-1 [Araneus ventricosus]